jgi:hypothetical protein
MKNEKQSKAALIRWSKVDPEKRSAVARNAVTKRWAKTSPEKRKEIAMEMVKARTKIL